jgi:sugar phosphate isomerase/epimerase
MPAFFISATNDEIAPDPAEQVACLQALGIAGIDIRSAWGKPIQHITNDEAAQLKKVCARANITIQAIVGTAVPILLTTPLSDAIANLERLIALAQFFGTQRIRITAGEIPPDTRSADFMGASIGRLRHLAQLAEAAQITLLLENAPGTAGDIPGNIHSILHGVKSAFVRLAWNPGNFVQAGVGEQVAEYQGMLLKYVGDVCLHDANLNDKQPCLPGEGDGRLRELLTLLRAAEYAGNITLQPSLTDASGGGLDSAETLRLAAAMLPTLFSAAGIKA